METNKHEAPAAEESRERKGYNEPNPAQPQGPNSAPAAREPTESETTKDKKNRPVNAEKKLQG